MKTIVLTDSTTTCHTEIAMMIPSFLKCHIVHLILNESVKFKKSYLFLSIKVFEVSKSDTNLVLDFMSIDILNIRIISIILVTIRPFIN